MELVFLEDSYARSCEATVSGLGERGIILDRTVFYATGGGQPGDTGRLVLEDGTSIDIVNAVKGAERDTVEHVPAEDAAPATPGMKCTAAIDWERRHRLMRVHTCMHLLSSLVPYPVTGGQVGDGTGRLDFDLSGASLDKDALTEQLNTLIAADHPVTERWISDEELAAQPELVKTMSVKPPTGAGRVRLIEIGDCDLQPCGGTHVTSTAEVGNAIVTKIKNKGQHNRRVSLALVD